MCAVKNTLLHVSIKKTTVVGCLEWKCQDFFCWMLLTFLYASHRASICGFVSDFEIFNAICIFFGRGLVALLNILICRRLYSELTSQEMRSLHISWRGH